MKRSTLNLATAGVCLGIAVALIWLVALFHQQLPEARRLAAGDICLIPAAQSEQLMPAICVTAEARTPRGPNTISVILSRNHLGDFITVVDAERMHSPAAPEPPLYDIRRSTGNHSGSLSRTQMRATVARLIGLLDSQYAVTEKAALQDVLRRLG